jgi:hypothetical protein
VKLGGGARLTDLNEDDALEATEEQLVVLRDQAHNIYRTFGWACRLMFRKIERVLEPPASRIPMRSVGGGHADHDLSVTTLTIDRSVPEAQRQVEHAASH